MDILGKNKRNIPIIILIVILVLIFIMVFVLEKLWIPLSEYKNISVFDDKFRNYQSSLHVFISSIVGLFGVVLGFYYYHEKVKTDNHLVNAKRLSDKVGQLQNELKQCNDIVFGLYNKAINNADIKTALDNLQLCCERISVILESDVFSKIDNKSIYALLSEYSNSTIVKIDKLEDINEPILKGREKYSNLYFAASKHLLTLIN